MNGNPKGLCIKMNMTLVELKKHIYNTLYVSGDININMEYMGLQRCGVFHQLNIENYNEEYNKLYITHTIQQDV